MLRASGDRGPNWLRVAAWPAAVLAGGRRVGNLGQGGGAARPCEAPARLGGRRRPLPGCRAALGPLSVCWQEAPAHAVLVNIQTRDFSQSKSTSTFFENLPKNSKRREFLAPSSCRCCSKFATKGVLGKGVIVFFFLLFKECEIWGVGGAESQTGERCRKLLAERLASFRGQEILHSLALFNIIFNLILI